MKQRKWKNIILVFCFLFCIGIGVSQIELKSVNTYQQEQKELAEQMGLGETINSQEAEEKKQEVVDATSECFTDEGGDNQQTEPKKKDKKEKTLKEVSQEEMQKKSQKKDKETKAEKETGKKNSAKETTKKSKTNKKDEKKAKTTKKPSVGQGNISDSTCTPLVSPTENANSSIEEGKEETSAPILVTETPVSNPNSATATPTPASTEEAKTLTCELEIDCTVLLDNMDKVEEGTKSYVPANGMILDKKEVKVEEGDTVYDVLSKVCKAYNIQLDAEYSKMYSSSYVKGIGYIYEKCAGTRSGWVYMVNGKSPNKGASQYQLSDGDVISWVYTCTGRAGS